MATNQPSAPVPPTCLCESCPCPAPVARANTWLGTRRAYGHCPGVWPNCPEHGVCSACGDLTTGCCCVGGPTHH